MIGTLRKKYNLEFSQEKYNAFIQHIGTAHGHFPPFKIGETPVFFPKSFQEKLFEACDHVSDVIASPAFLEYSLKALLPERTVPNETKHTTFLVIDFGVCKDINGAFIPQLIEVQGFPSLYFYQHLLAKAFRKFFDIPENFSHLFHGLDETSYIELMKRVILGHHHPENVILLEIEPEKQPTAIDFIVTKATLGIEVLCITKVKKSGRELYYTNAAGKNIRIEKIYNRVIFDELLRRTDLNEREFFLTDDVDVEWVGHPNWFFRISKHTMPLIKSPYVPESTLLSDFSKWPEDLENYVLKPLYSFSGTGVKIHCTEADLNAIKYPDQYMLQRKVEYAPFVETLDDPAKCEVRMMMIWEPHEPRPKVVTNLVRLSKGEMIGVRYNKDKTWVGGSIGFFEK